MGNLWTAEHRFRCTLHQQYDYSKQWSESLGLGDEYPAYYVSYDDCKDFITALNAKLSDQLPEGVSFRLPTEAEWEFAAKGGSQTHGYMFAGSDSINDVGWYRDNSNLDIHKVALKAPNELGLYDMTGNLEEWCLDVYDSYSKYEQTNPTGPNSGYRRVVRGGNYCLNPNQCTNTYRNTDSDLTREHLNGMRLALDWQLRLFPVHGFVFLIRVCYPSSFLNCP